MVIHSAITSDPLPELLPIDLVVARLRIAEPATESERTDLRLMVSSAMDWAEGHCGQPLFERSYRIETDGFVSGTLKGVSPRNIAVSYRTATLSDPVPLSYTESAYSNPYRIFPTGLLVFDYPSVSSITSPRVSVTYTAGYALDQVPAAILDAVLLVTYDRYDNRANPVSERQTAAERLLQPYKLYWL